MNKSESIAALAASLSKAQGEIVDAVKDKAAHKYKYADLGQILNIVRPLFCKHSLAFTQLPTRFIADNGVNYVSLETVVMHDSGEWLSSDYVMPVEQPKGMSMAQAYGSVITYARRYALASIVGITQEDNDAQVNREEKTKQQEYSDKAAGMVADFSKKMNSCGTFDELKEAYTQAYTWAKDNSDSFSGKQIQKVYNDFKILGGWA